jgi:hypothetical protein
MVFNVGLPPHLVAATGLPIRTGRGRLPAQLRRPRRDRRGLRGLPGQGGTVALIEPGGGGRVRLRTLGQCGDPEVPPPAGQSLTHPAAGLAHLDLLTSSCRRSAQHQRPSSQAPSLNLHPFRVISGVAAQPLAVLDQRVTVAGELDALLAEHPLAEALTSMPGVGARTAVALC